MEQWQGGGSLSQGLKRMKGWAWALVEGEGGQSTQEVGGGVGDTGLPPLLLLPASPSAPLCLRPIHSSLPQTGGLKQQKSVILTQLWRLEA